MALNLGDVTFGLNADYTGLVAAQSALKAMGTNFGNTSKFLQQQAINNQVAFSNWGKSAAAAAQQVNGFTGALQKLHAIVSAVAGPLSHTANVITQLGNLTKTMGTGMGLAVGGVSALTVAAVHLGNAVVDAASEWQKLVGILTSVTGSSYLAERQLQTLMQISIETGTEFAKSAEEFGRFEAAVVGAGGSVKTAFESFKGVTDQVAALRLPAENSAHALLALQQMMSAGKVQGQELRQLYNALPGSLDLMAKGLGITVQQLKAQAKSGLDAQKAVKALADEQIKMFQGPAKANADTFTGAVNNLHTAWLSFLVEVEKNFHILEVVTIVIQGITGAVIGLKQALDSIAHRPFGDYVESAEAAHKATKDFLDTTKGTGVTKNVIAMWAGDAQARIMELDKQIAEVTTRYEYLESKKPNESLLNQTRDLFGQGPAQKSADTLTALTRLQSERAAAMAQLDELNKRMANAPGTDLSGGIALTAQQIERMNAALSNAKTQIADLQTEYTAILVSTPAEYKRAMEQVNIDKQVAQFRSQLVQAKVPLGEVNNLTLHFKTNLEGLANLKPAIPIMDEIDKQRAILEDAGAGVLKYAQYYDMLKGQPTQTLMKISQYLGLATTDTATLAKAMDDLATEADRAKELEKNYEGVEKKIKDMSYEYEILTGDVKTAHQYMKDPELFKSMQDYYEYLVDVEHQEPDTAKATVDAIYAQRDALDKLEQQVKATKTTGEIATDALQAGFDSLGSSIENVFRQGKIQAQDFLNILEDMLTTMLNVIMEEALLKPLGQAASSAFGGMFGSSGEQFSLGAKGLVFSNDNILPMAKGSVLYRPTIFPMAGGAAVASEYGQNEAVMPLKRTSTGDLGVSAQGWGGSNVTVNVINQAAPDVKVETRSSKDGRGQINLEILVAKAVAKDIRSGGPVGQSIATMFSSNQRVTSR